MRSGACSGRPGRAARGARAPAPAPEVQREGLAHAAAYPSIQTASLGVGSPSTAALEVHHGQHAVAQRVEDGRTQHRVVLADQGRRLVPVWREVGSPPPPRAVRHHRADQRRAHALDGLAPLAGHDLLAGEPAHAHAPQPQRLLLLDQQQQRLVGAEPVRGGVERAAERVLLVPSVEQDVEDGVHGAEEPRVVPGDGEDGVRHGAKEHTRTERGRARDVLRIDDGIPARPLATLSQSVRNRLSQIVWGRGPGEQNP